MIDLAAVLALLFGQAKPAEPAQSKPAAVQESERPAIPAAELKALRDTNLFAPRTLKRRPPETRSATSRSSRIDPPAAPPKPKPPVVTGIFFDGKEEAWLVVVEDRNSDSLKQFKEPKFLKVGGEVTGFTVTAVTAEKATFLKGEASKELKVGESLPADDRTPVSAAPATEDPEAPPPAEVEIKPADAEANSRILEELRKKRGKKDRPSNDE